MVRQQRWKLLLPLLVALMLIGGFWTPQTVGAADGVNVSNMDKTYAIANGVSPDGFKVCVVWSRFDTDPQAFVRVFDVLTSTWSPALNSAPFQLTSGGFNGVESTRCAFDTDGTLHAVWQQKSGGAFEIVHRSLPAGANPANAGSWSGITTIDSNGDGSDIAEFQGDENGRVWLVHRKYQGSSGSQIYVRSRQSGGGWSSPAIFTTSGEAGNPRVGVDNLGYVHLAWKNGNGGRGYAFYNSTNGQFSSEVGIPNSNNAGNFSMAVNRENGDVHIVFSKDFNKVNYVKKTGQGSLSFGGATVIATADDRSLSPQIAWSPSRLIVAFDSGNKERIDVITSDNQGTSWNSIQTLASPDGGAESPWVSADQVGNAYVAYAHRGDGTVYFTGLAGFVPEGQRCAGFADVRTGTPACPAIESLTRTGVIQGYNTNPPTFGPNQSVQRAQIAAFLVRALGWQNMPQGPNTFNDFGPLVGELREASLILANACTNTNDPNTCIAKGYGDGRFGPNEGVTYAQVMTFIARAFIYDGTWQAQSEPHPYNGVPQVHEADVRTYDFYAGQVTAVSMPSGDGWNQAAPRAWVAVVLYQALQAAR